jgi:transposase
MKHLRWVSRVPVTLTAAKMLLDNMPQEAFNQSVRSGYRIALSCSEYAGVQQRWFVVESQARKDAEILYFLLPVYSSILLSELLH